MGVIETLSRWAGGKTTAFGGNDLLREYLACTMRAAQLARHADMAPQEHSAQALRALATAEQAQAERLRDALQGAGISPPPSTTPPPPSGALNHWGRLVQDLEAHRSSARGLRELAMHFAERLPSTAALIDDLCNEETVHCERIRGLIARADPQALD